MYFVSAITSDVMCSPVMSGSVFIYVYQLYSGHSCKRYVVLNENTSFNMSYVKMTQYFV